jgi:hypothetical protein
MPWRTIEELKEAAGLDPNYEGMDKASLFCWIDKDLGNGQKDIANVTPLYVMKLLDDPVARPPCPNFRRGGWVQSQTPEVPQFLCETNA